MEVDGAHLHGSILSFKLQDRQRGLIRVVLDGDLRSSRNLFARLQPNFPLQFSELGRLPRAQA